MRTQSAQSRRTCFKAHVHCFSYAAALPSRSACVAPRVQKIAETTSTTIPGHSSTHSCRGRCAYAAMPAGHATVRSAGVHNGDHARSHKHPRLERLLRVRLIECTERCCEKQVSRGDMTKPGHSGTRLRRGHCALAKANVTASHPNNRSACTTSIAPAARPDAASSAAHSARIVPGNSIYCIRCKCSHGRTAHNASTHIQTMREPATPPAAALHTFCLWTLPW
jgi:hypothetical protein